jgi:hypothetical protein
VAAHGRAVERHTQRPEIGMQLGVEMHAATLRWKPVGREGEGANAKAWSRRGGPPGFGSGCGTGKGWAARIHRRGESSVKECAPAAGCAGRESARRSARRRAGRGAAVR